MTFFQGFERLIRSVVEWSFRFTYTALLFANSPYLPVLSVCGLSIVALQVNPQSTASYPSDLMKLSQTCHNDASLVRKE